MFDARELALANVNHERQRQNKLRSEGKFQYTLADEGISDGLRLAALAEEIGEVGRNMLAREGIVDDGDPSDKALYNELCQVAALAVAWMEYVGRTT